MSKFTVQKIENPSEAEINASAQLFCDVMHTDKAANILSGGDLSSLKLKTAAMIRTKTLASGEYYTATNKNGEMVGYAVWTPPGHELSSAEDDRALGLTEPTAEQEFFKTQYLVHLPQFFNSHLGPAGRKDAWWLDMAVVRSDYQRQGVLKALFNLVYEKASSGDTLACSTTNDNNVPIFLALGFTHKGTHVASSPLGDWKTHLFSLKV